MHLFYLKSAQPEIFLSLRGNRLIIKPKTLFSHHFYVSIKLASEKGRHTHIPVSLEKTEGPFTQESTLTHSAMHSFMMWREIQGGRPSSQRNPCSPVLQVLPLVSARKSLTSGMNMAHICSTAEVTVALWTAAGWEGWPGSTPVTHFSREVPNQICNHASYYTSSMEKGLQENNFISLLGSVSRCVGGNQRTRGHNHFSPFVWITGIELRSSSSAASPFTHCLTGLGNIFYKLIFIYKNSMHLGNRFSKTVFFLELDVVFVHTVIMLKSPYNTVQRYSITLWTPKLCHLLKELFLVVVWVGLTANL